MSDDSLAALAALRRIQQQQQQTAPTPPEIQFSGNDYELKLKLRRMITGIERNSDAQALTSMKLLLRLADNILGDPENTKWHSFKPTNSIIKRDLMDPKGTVEYAREMGFSPEVHDYQPLYVFNPKRLHQLRVAADVLRDTMTLATEKEARAVNARKNEKAVAAAAAEKVRLAFEDDRKRKQLHDKLEKERREARMEAAARRAEEQAVEREEQEREEQEQEDHDTDEEEEEEGKQAFSGGGNVLGSKPGATIASTGDDSD